MNQQATTKKHILLLLLIILVGLAVKYLFFAFLNAHLHFPLQFLADDSDSYLSPAIWFLKTGTFYTSKTIGHYMFVRTPGYPAFIAALYYFFGQHITVIVLAQIALSIVPIICLYVVGARLFSPVVGLLSAFLCMIDYLQTAHLYLVMADTLFADLVAVVVMIGVLALTNYKRFYAKLFLLGLALGLAVLVRPVGYFYVFPLALGFLAYMLFRRVALKKIIAALLLMFVPYVVLVGGWQIRNKIQVGTFEYSGISSNKGMGLLFPENYRLYIKAHPELQKKDKLDLSDDIGMLLAYPKDTLKAMSKGVVKVILGSDETMARLLLGRHIDTAPNYVAARRAVSHFDWQALKRANPTAATIVRLFSYYGMLALNVVLYLFLAFGLIFALRKGLLNKTLGSVFANILLLGTVMYFVLISSNAVHDVRYRIPFQPIIDLYAALGLVLFFSLFQKSEK